MWYKNKATRTKFILDAPEVIPTKEFVNEIYERYFAVKQPHDKNNNKVTCSKCGSNSIIIKKSKGYVCDCGYKHSKFKTRSFKNHADRIVIKTITKHDNEQIFNFYLSYLKYDKESKLIIVESISLIAKEVSVDIKRCTYHYNIAYSKPMSGYQIVSYKHDKNVSESVRTTMEYHATYYTKKQLDVLELKYVKTNDQFIIGYDLDTLKRNAYLIEILQKYKSSYLFHQLKDRTVSTKIIDLFDMRITELSNKKILSIIKYYAKSMSLDMSIYKDYLNDLRFLKLKMNRSNLLNKEYNARHIKLSNRVADMKNKNRDVFIEQAYNGYEEFEKDGIIIKFPVKQKDLNKESAVLNHCVRRYSDDIIDDKLKIFFVRVESETPFITVEVKGNKITQFRGLDNLTDHINPSLLAKAKKIMNDYLVGI